MPYNPALVQLPFDEPSSEPDSSFTSDLYENRRPIGHRQPSDSPFTHWSQSLSDSFPSDQIDRQSDGLEFIGVKLGLSPGTQPLLDQTPSHLHRDPGRSCSASSTSSRAQSKRTSKRIRPTSIDANTDTPAPHRSSPTPKQAISTPSSSDRHQQRIDQYMIRTLAPSHPERTSKQQRLGSNPSVDQTLMRLDIEGLGFHQHCPSEQVADVRGNTVQDTRTQGQPPIEVSRPFPTTATPMTDAPITVTAAAVVSATVSTQPAALTLSTRYRDSTQRDSTQRDSTQRDSTQRDEGPHIGDIDTGPETHNEMDADVDDVNFSAFDDDADNLENINPTLSSSTPSDAEYETTSDGVSTAGSDDEDEAAAAKTEDTRTDAELQRDTAVWIQELFTLQDFGCSTAHHQQTQETECGRSVELCYGLEETYNREYCILHAGSDARPVGLESFDAFPKPDEQARTRFLKDSTLRTQFEGIDDPDFPPKRICIHANHHQRLPPQLEFDFDAVIVLMASFQGFQRSSVLPTTTGDTAPTDAGATSHQHLHLAFAKQTRFNISTDLHIKVPVTYEGANRKKRSQNRPVHRIPHLYLGHVEMYTHTPIFVLFPRLCSDDRDSTWLSDDKAQQFFDAWLDACRQNVSEAKCQYLPANALCAERRTRVKGLEHQSVERESTMKQIREYAVSVASVQTAWETLQSRISAADSELSDFAGATILVNTKNTKLHDSTTSLAAAVRLFRRKFHEVFDPQYLHRYYADLGVKIVPYNDGPRRTTGRVSFEDSDDEDHHPPRRSSGAGRPDGGRERAYTYLWRTCCLQRFSEQIQTQILGGSKARCQSYHNGYLRDSTTLTVAPSPTSPLARGGVCYIQAYNQTKEIEDEKQIHPFNRPDLSNLALPPNLFKTRSIGTSYPTVAKSYLMSKRRVHDEYKSSRFTTFGSRLELRIAGETLTNMYNNVVAALDPSTQLASQQSVTPAFLWCVPTTTWCDFMRSNYHKITSLIEMVISYSPTTGISHEGSELLFLVLQYLQGFANSDPRRKGILWERIRINRRSQTDEIGLHLASTIPDFGFGWFTSIIDWQGFRLRPEFAYKLIGCHTAIGVHYKRRAAMSRVQDQRAVLECCYSYVRREPLTSTRMKRVLVTMAHIVLRQYRRDVLATLAEKNELHEDYRSTDTHDDVAFCDQGLQTVFAQKPYYVNHGRICGFKDATVLFDLLMGTAPHERKRTSMDGPKQKEWRRLIFQIQALTGERPYLAEMWRARLLNEFKRTMYCFPYPDPQGVFIETHSPTGQRKIFASGFVGNTWRCLGLEPRQDVPPPPPESTNMDLHTFQTYIEGIQP